MSARSPQSDPSRRRRALDRLETGGIVLGLAVAVTSQAAFGFNLSVNEYSSNRAYIGHGDDGAPRPTLGAPIRDADAPAPETRRYVADLVDGTVPAPREPRGGWRLPLTLPPEPGGGDPDGVPDEGGDEAGPTDPGALAAAAAAALGGVGGTLEQLPVPPGAGGGEPGAGEPDGDDPGAGDPGDGEAGEPEGGDDAPAGPEDEPIGDPSGGDPGADTDPDPGDDPEDGGAGDGSGPDGTDPEDGDDDPGLDVLPGVGPVRVGWSGGAAASRAGAPPRLVVRTPDGVRVATARFGGPTGAVATVDLPPGLYVLSVLGRVERGATPLLVTA